MRLMSNPEEDLLPLTEFNAARRSAAELPPFMRFSRSGSRGPMDLEDRDPGVAHRDFESSSIGLEGASEPLDSAGAADVVG